MSLGILQFDIVSKRFNNYTNRALPRYKITTRDRNLTKSLVCEIRGQLYDLKLHRAASLTISLRQGIY